MPAWMFQHAAGGGALADVGVYCVNTVRWLVGKEPVEATAHQWTVDPKVFREVDENIAFRLNFPGGLVMHGVASWGGAETSYLQMVGEKGWAMLAPAYEFTVERRFFGRIGKRDFDKKYPVINELALELDALADCIRRHREPAPNGLAGLRDVAVMEAIYEAARQGQPVKIG
jgi:predicted dehydrogenase